MRERDIVIVVPIYKKHLDSMEEISLLQLNRILGKHPMMYVAPRSLDMTEYKSYGITQVIRFDDDFFTDTLSYSSLCISNELYENLHQYKYILIYQLDAFVFSDRLSEFCEMNYDYIGAPVSHESWGELPFHVGNGGFSLRKTESILRIIRQKDKLMKEFGEEFGEYYAKLINGWEDCFYAYCGYREDVNFRVPDVRIAFEFAVEYNINGIYRTLSERLPFGCHRWYGNRFDKWWPIISKYGYKIKEKDYGLYANQYPWHEYRAFMRLVDRGNVPEQCGEMIRSIFPEGVVSLWGYGVEGKRIADYLNILKVKVDKIFDKKLEHDGMVEFPSAENIIKNRYPLIVSTTLYENQVTSELEKIGLKDNNDFYKWSSIVLKLLPLTDIMDIGARI